MERWGTGFVASLARRGAGALRSTFKDVPAALANGSDLPKRPLVGTLPTAPGSPFGSPMGPTTRHYGPGVKCLAAGQ
jgi:hypothetical protein